MPVTRTSIMRLRSSRTKPNGTTNSPGNSIQLSEAVDSSLRAKIRQAPTKLARTARHDRKLLSPRERRVSKVIPAAATSGTKRTNQVEFIVNPLNTRKNTEGQR